MRVLILTNGFWGLYSFRKEVVELLLNSGYDVFISAPFDEKRSFFEEIGCKIIYSGFDSRGTNPFRDIKLCLHYIRVLKAIKPEVVLSYTIKPNVYGGIACQICHTPQIANITGLGSAVENPGWLQKVTVFLYKVGLRKAHTVFFQNKANLQFCESRNMVPSNRILIPGSGVNLQYHKLQEYPEDGTIKFIFISRLIKEKGIEEYLKAAEIIKSKHHNTEFHIVGPSEESYTGIIAELQGRGVIIYHGKQSDVRPFIKESHCTIHPSFYPEGMSNVLLESCAAGRPIITTNRPGCGEIVEDGVNGFLVRARDVGDLVSVIERFLSLPYLQKRQMGVKGREKVEREFDRQIVVESYLNEISKVLGK